jgi:AcrR family transcriptional regulator
MRPTREQTRARLIEVAADLFAERGVLGTSIEELVAAAGYTRGAFYSSFTDRDDLAHAVTEHSVRSAIAANQRLLAEVGPVELIDALRRRTPSVNPLLNVELLLHALRSSTGRAQYAALLQELRSGLAPVVEATLKGAGVTQPIDALGAVTLMIALEDGIMLHSLLDPSAVPPGAYLQVLGDLVEASRTSTQPVRGIARATPLAEKRRSRPKQ